MGLLSGFNVTLPEIEILGQAARAAFSGAAIPNGWSVLTPQQLGLAPQYWDGLYFTDNGASAIVLQQGNSIIVSFRGTDSTADSFYYPELLFGTYINRFQPLLTAGASAWRYAFLFYWNEPWWRRRQSDGGHRVLRIRRQIRSGAICCICFANHCQCEWDS